MKSPTRSQSFGFAFRGIAVLIRSQTNARIHLLATCIVVAGGVLFKLTALEWCLIILAMMLVWATEAINTAIEGLADTVTQQVDARIEKAKDVAAAAVLISAMGAVVLGLLIFGSRIITLFTGQT